MDTLIHVLETALPVFLTLGLGVLCRRTKLLSPEGVKALKSVAVNITLPAVLFSAFATAEYSAKSIAIPIIIFALCVLAFYLGRIGCNLLKIPGRLSPFMATGFEAGMLGYALFTLLFGAGEVSRFAIVDLGQVLFVFTMYKIMLSGRGDWRGAVREALVSPTIWAICAGLLLGATGAFKALEPSPARSSCCPSAMTWYPGRSAGPRRPRSSPSAWASWRSSWAWPCSSTACSWAAR